jgi:hypothetical protein
VAAALRKRLSVGLDAFDQWAFCALTRSPGARTFYDQHRANGDTHH